MRLRRLLRSLVERTQLSAAQLLALCCFAAVALAATALSLSWLMHREQQTLREQTHAHARERVELLRTTTLRSLEVLHSLSAFVTTTPEVSRGQFAAFVHGALERLPELQALEWVPAVADHERAEYEARARADGLSDFSLTELDAHRKLRPARGRPEYFPVFYVEPQRPNAAALGLDLSADPARKSALDRARTSGRASATAPIQLAQETRHGQFGFLVFLPVYAAAAPTRLEPRGERGSLRGLVLAVFRVRDLMRPALSPESALTRHGAVADARETQPRSAPAQFDVAVTDVDEPDKVLFRVGDGSVAQGSSAALASVEELSIAGRRFRFRFAPTRDFMRTHGYGGSYGYPWLGLMLALSVAAYVARGKARGNLLARSNALLEREIEIRKGAQQEAAAAREAQSRFLANVSHELRTPLNAIVGYSQLLSRHELPEPRRQQAFATIVESSNHLLGLVDEVLDLSKIEAGHVDLHEVDFNLGSLISGLSALVSQRCEKKGLTLKVEGLGSGPCWVRGDEGKLRQVLLNLLGNAVKFTRAGEVRLRVVPEEGQSVRFEVIDTGRGIEQADQARVFGAFVRADDGAGSEGAGLGLAICKRLVAVMGGELTLRSTPGWGSDFFFSIPFAAPRCVVSSQCERREPSVRLADGASCHALVVDDVRANRELLSEVLTAVGCTVSAAESGAAALALLRSRAAQPHASTPRTGSPDIIFMDILMPGMDGIETARRILQQPELDPIKLVALSASALKGQRERYLAAGFHDFVAKPFRVERINDCLASLLTLPFVPDERAVALERDDRADRADGSALEWAALVNVALPAPLSARIRHAAELYQTTRLRSALAELRGLGNEPRALAELLEAHAVAYDMRGILDKLDALEPQQGVLP
jgi:signal transduction histidine kinase/DNA-binding NarL/FixJ family response regulator